MSVTAANSSPDPGRVSTAVENRADTDYIRFDTVINRKGKVFSQTAVISENFRVNTTLNGQGVDILQDRLAKVFSETAALLLIKSKPGD